MSTVKTKSILVISIFVGMITSTVVVKAQSSEEKAAFEITTPVEQIPPDIDGGKLFAELLAHNALRNAALAGYTEERIYRVTDITGKVRAQEIGQMEYRAPDKKTFITTSESGSGLVRHLALNSLIESEIDAASAKQHHDSAISPANYSFELLGEQQVGPYRCFLVRATPKRQDKYLFEGKVWIDVEDYAVVRIAGHPAKKLSFWVERADFIREYQKVDGFWLSKRDQTFVQIKMYGEKILIIEHQNYVVDGAVGVQESAQNRGN